MGPCPYGSALIKRAVWSRHTRGEKLCDQEGRSLGDASVRQEQQRWPVSHSSWERGPGRNLPHSLGRTRRAEPGILAFVPPDPCPVCAAVRQQPRQTDVVFHAGRSGPHRVPGSLVLRMADCGPTGVKEGTCQAAAHGHCHPSQPLLEPQPYTGRWPRSTASMGATQAIVPFLVTLVNEDR